MLVRRYGLDDRKPATLAVLSAKLSVSRERVRRLQRSAEAYKTEGRRALTRFRGASPAAGSNDGLAESALVIEGLYVFTDTKGATASCFSAQRWVVTPMAGADHDYRLIRMMFKPLEVEAHLRTRSY